MADFLHCGWVRVCLQSLHVADYQQDLSASGEIAGFLVYGHSFFYSALNNLKIIGKGIHFRHSHTLNISAKPHKNVLHFNAHLH